VFVCPVDRQRRPAGLLLRSGAGSKYRSIAAAAARHAGRVNVGPTIRRSSVGPTCLETLTFYWYFIYRARDHRRNHGWKVGRDLRWGGLPITVVFFHPFPVYPYCSTPPVSTVPFPTSLSSPPKRQFGQSAVRSPYCRAKMTTSRKSWRGPCTTGPHVLRSWRGRVPRVPYGVCAHAHMIVASISQA